AGLVAPPFFSRARQIGWPDLSFATAAGAAATRPLHPYSHRIVTRLSNLRKDVMGYNRSGAIAKKRKRRRRKEEARLAKKASAQATGSGGAAKVPAEAGKPGDSAR